jgi:uncharacterized damage-inducible protein DinB
MKAEEATFLAQQLTGMIEGEFRATCKVLKAVENGDRNYKPDPKSRSAWELATHLATGDVWFLDSIIDGAFKWDPEAPKKIDASFKTIEGVVGWYEKTLPQRLATVRALPPEKLTRTVDFFGFFQWPAVQFLGFANNHSVHHRGQLAAYLRAMGSKVPAIYGSSADETIPG